MQGFELTFRSNSTPNVPNIPTQYGQIEVATTTFRLNGQTHT
ncbi:hypothetical protein QUA54_09490 [Microcoleus sp. MOSTC5]|uniref:Uncharacterized protein n=1 Tax=Phormidium nigroviride PCC 7112 TaxID=179408 RepID=K9VRI0_9CYAN|nr:hypothetical protein [Oscillatoria nigro-viridis]AFZ10698.1 hypothetical protein Osc7112_6567 [Oscillatoria nigro-viridis PCC 7112]